MFLVEIPHIRYNYPRFNILPSLNPDVAVVVDIAHVDVFVQSFLVRMRRENVGQEVTVPEALLVIVGIPLGTIVLVMSSVRQYPLVDVTLAQFTNVLYRFVTIVHRA